jgi:sugar O-acyltransferase (sialic acid O-acetyltransferase NeuD family)
MAKIVIFGTTEMAELTHFYLTHDTTHETIAFTVDGNYMKEASFCGLPVVPFEEVEAIYPPNEYKMRVALWYSRTNKLRAEKYYQAKAKGYDLINYISSKATIWPGLIIGDNCFVSVNAMVGPFSVIGNDVTLTHNATVSDHAAIKDHCHLAPHACVLSGATVEEYCFIGANSTIRNNIIVARECLIGAGALILENTEEKRVYKGNPAGPLPKRSDELKRI